MAASSWNGNQPRLGVAFGEVPEIINVSEGSAQSFKAGTPVKLSSGSVVIAADGAVGFLGIALEDAAGATTNTVPVMLCRPNSTEVIARVTDNGTDTLPTALVQGNGYGWYKDADDVFYVDKHDDSNVTFIYERPVYDVNGDSTYWGIFRLKAGLAGSIDEEGA